MKTLFTTIAAVAVLVSASAHAAPDATCYERMRTDAASNQAMVATVSDVVCFGRVRDEASAAPIRPRTRIARTRSCNSLLAITAVVAAVTEKPTSEFVKEVAILQAAASLRQLEQLATLQKLGHDFSLARTFSLATLNGLINGIVLAALTSCEPTAMNGIALITLLLTLAATTAADAGTRCRSTTMGSTTWTTCESPKGKTECRASRLDHVHHLSLAPAEAMNTRPLTKSQNLRSALDGAHRLLPVHRATVKAFRSVSWH